MLRYLPLFLILPVIPSLRAQTLHSPVEILQLMISSTLEYELGEWEGEIPCKDYSEKVLTHGIRSETTDSGQVLMSVLPNAVAKPFFDQAEYFFAQQQFDSARVYYLKVLAVQPDLTLPMVYIGQVEGIQGNYKDAAKWYKKVIKKDYYDYLAHWLLADIYYRTDNLKKAVEEIAIAQILNRNNPRLAALKKEIFEKAGRNCPTWCFAPQMEITRESDTKISIKSDDLWLPYALTKAVWQYEPGYAAQMGVAPGVYSTLEDHEALHSLLVVVQNNKTDLSSYPALATLEAAGQKKMINAYIIYEILLPRRPAAVFQLPVETIEEVKNYILEVREK